MPPKLAAPFTIAGMTTVSQSRTTYVRRGIEVQGLLKMFYHCHDGLFEHGQPLASAFRRASAGTPQPCSVTPEWRAGSARSEPLAISVKILHPRGGEPGDGAREAVVSEIMSAWHRIDTQVGRVVDFLASGDGTLLL